LWTDIALPGGALFVVGDPKQSIYRFRRASIETYLAAQDRFADHARLTTNFRTTEPVLTWINSVFSKLIVPVAGGQPEYVPLDPFRSEELAGAPVTLLGSVAHPDAPNAATLREREAADVTGSILEALATGWEISAESEVRTLRPRDIAVLVPARTSLPFLEDALETAGIPFRTESSSLVYQAAEVRELMAALRVLADPTDRLAAVTALRSPLFGCGDDDLARFRHLGGSFTITAPQSEGAAESPVGHAVDYLRRLHYRSRWMTPSEVLSALVEERRVLEVSMSDPRARDTWRRVRFIIDQARAWMDAAGGGLRDYVAWAAAQADETSRVAEAVLPETDVDAVKIMTVHAAKGLEFPMVVLSGMTSVTSNRAGVKLLWHDDGFEVSISSRIQTGDFQVIQPLDEQMDQLERRRLLYVAATRARDHLVVSLHRAGNRATNASLLFSEGEAASVPGAYLFESRGEALWAQPTGVEPVLPESWEEWESRTNSARDASLTDWSRSASGLEGTEPEFVLAEPSSVTESEDLPGSAKGARDLDLPAWAKGRYGTAIGRAVHASLQTLDLPDASNLAGVVRAQCVAEGVTEFEDLVTNLVQSAVASEVVQLAAASQHWREMFVGTADADGVILEGIIDLLYRDASGQLVIVDYKTDAVPVDAIPARVAYYRPQVAAYRRALQAATGEDASPVLLFLDVDGRPARAVSIE
jgi:ATP-dependent exoDNAse (exonuclease V) beta subunit